MHAPFPLRDPIVLPLHPLGSPGGCPPKVPPTCVSGVVGLGLSTPAAGICRARGRSSPWVADSEDRRVEGCVQGGPVSLACCSGTSKPPTLGVEWRDGASKNGACLGGLVGSTARPLLAGGRHNLWPSCITGSRAVKAAVSARNVR